MAYFRAQITDRDAPIDGDDDGDGDEIDIEG